MGLQKFCRQMELKDTFTLVQNITLKSTHSFFTVHVFLELFEDTSDTYNSTILYKNKIVF